jgi:cytochrome c-type biogenesis protein CcmH
MRPEAAAARAALAAALLWFAGAPPALPADRSPQEAVEAGLMCYCGCSDLTVRVCTCGTAAAIRSEIADRLAKGESEAEVLAAFVARHGEKILSAPTREGFNLLAWIMPFAVLLVTAAALVVVIRRWERRGGGGGTAAPAASGPPLSDDQRRTLERIEREIRDAH